MQHINHSLINNNILEALHECIKQQKFNILKLLCIIYQDEYKNNKEFNDIFSLIKNNNIQDLLKFEKKIRVFVCCNWCSSRELCNIWNKMSKGNCDWDNIQIVSEEPADFYCVINKPPDNILLDHSKTILLRMEPYMEMHPEIWGNYWSKPNKNSFLFYGYDDINFSNIEWHISKSYSQLQNEKIIKEYNILSTVLSDKYFEPGHVKRVDFVKFLENKGMIVNVFGSNKFSWKNYKGSLPYHKKDDALFPYKYTFNCENNSIKNYCTEKLYDSILSECLTFYSGCPNVKDIIDEKAYVYLKLENFEEDYLTVRRAIEEDLWTQRIPFIKEAKNKILNELQFFPRIEKIISNL